MIKGRNINKQYAELKVLKNLSFDFNRGELIAIVGKSGSGKSTLLNIIGGLDHSFTGDLIINDTDTNSFNKDEWSTYRKQQVGYIFQDFKLIPHLTVLDNVEIILHNHGVSHGECRKRAIETLIKVGLGDHLKKKPGKLSGGEQQRVAIARAIVHDPQIILADEPTGQLDYDTAKDILQLIKNLCKNKLVIIVTHMEEITEHYITRKIKLSDGEIITDQLLEKYTISKQEHNLSTNKVNIGRITLKNMISKKCSSFMMMLTIAISIALLLVTMPTSNKQLVNHLLTINHSDVPLNRVILHKDNKTSFSDDEINNIEKINGIQSIISNPIDKVMIINGDVDQYVKQLREYDNIEQVENKKYKPIERLPSNQNQFYLGQAIYGDYPKNNNEILINVDYALAYLDGMIKNKNYESRYRYNQLSKEKVLELIQTYQSPTLVDLDLERVEIKNRQPLKIVGIVDNDIWSYSKVNYYVHHSMFDYLEDFYDEKLVSDELIIYLSEYNEEDRTRLKSEIELLDETYQYDTSYDKDVIEAYLQMNQYMKIIEIFVVIVLVIGGILFSVIFSSNISYRIKEIGILKSFGASNSTIKKLFLSEYSVITIVGIVLAYPLSILFLQLIQRGYLLLVNVIDKDIVIVTISPSLKEYLFITVISVIVMIFMTLIPTYRYTRLNIVDALKK